METEDELAEDLTPSQRQRRAVTDRLGCVAAHGPEEEEGDGMETEEETRSPRGRRGRVLELTRH